MVFDYCSNSNVQLVASSNDAFLMDVVDIAKWQILQRNGSSVTTLNQSRNYDMFRSFRMTGLGGLFVVALFDAVEEAVFAPGADVALGGGLGDAEPAGELEEGLGGEGGREG